MFKVQTADKLGGLVEDTKYLFKFSSFHKVLRKFTPMNVLCRFKNLPNRLKPFFSTASNMSPPVVTVKEGKLRGAEEKLYDGSTYYSFKGIPYAEPPVGKLRFKAPLPVKAWTDVLEATEHGPLCPQFDINIMSETEGDENCLYLNVYTKSLESSSKLPVIVYIHGGGFMSGSGNDDMLGPKYLLQHDVILVTINYRLEVLGFLCLDIPEVPGNAGMKDQVLALQWVQNNIAKFGGDPNNVTLYGESAGGASVTYHLMSSMSKGLFHKAISHSGVCTVDWASDIDGVNRSFRVGKAIGKETKDPYELLDHLQKLPSLSLVNLTRKTNTPDEMYRGLPFRFTPVIEKRFDNVQPFIDRDPINILSEKSFNQVPLMVGYNSNEGIIAIKDRLKKADVFNKHPDHLIPRIIATRISEEDLKEYGVRLKKFYFGDGGFGKETAESIIKMQSDIHFVYECHRFVHYYAATNAPIYMFRFGCDTELNMIKVLLGLTKYKGTCHADDIFYFFSNMISEDTYNQKENLRQLVYRTTKLYTDFAKTGNPTPDNSLGVQWTPYTRSNKAYMDIKEQLSMGTNAESEGVTFWNKLYQDAGVPSCIKSSL